MWLRRILKSKAGLSLMEVIVSLFVIMVLTLGIYDLVIMSLNITADNKYYVEAISIANQRMERIRNMAYRDVGVASGIPNGTIPQVETVTRDNIFTVNSYVTYYDDPFDGQAGSTTPDTIPNDYKIASVKVSWQSKSKTKSMTVFSKIIPRTVETSEGYGLLKIIVSNASAQPLANANVRVVNNLVNPPIDVVNLTNNQGILYLPATSSYQGYEITVTKTDEEPAIYYGTDQSYATSTGKSPFHLSVTEGDMTEEAFTIDKLAAIKVRTVSTNLPDNWQVSETDYSREMLYPEFSRDNADNMYFVWQGWSGTSSYVYVQKYNSAAVRQWAQDKKISSTNWQTNPDITTTLSGNSFVVWQDNSSSLKLVTRGAPLYRLANIDLPGKSLLAGDYSVLPDSFNYKYYSSPFYAVGKQYMVFKNMPDKIARTAKQIYYYTLDALNDFKIDQARAAGTIMQTKISNVENSANDLTATFDSPPSNGNIIIAIAMHRNDWASFSAPTNAAGAFTEAVYSNSNWYLDVGIWYKVAGAAEPSQVTINNSGDIDGGVMMLLELAGIDAADPLDVVSANDQTGSNSNTATTLSTAQSEASGFALAAIGWGDNNFDTPNSSSWSSGSADNWTHELWRDWSSGHDGSLAVAALDVTSAAAQRATLTTTGGGGEQRNSVLAVFNTVNADIINLSATGTQISSIMVGSSTEYMGGAFVIADNTSSRNVTSITITEDGTVDAQNELANIKLYYDIDSTLPYDCSSEAYNGTEPQFGATDSDGFSGISGTSTFTDVVGISTTDTLCVYIVLDVDAAADKDDTIEIEISKPAEDVILSTGSVVAGPAVALLGTTNISIPPELHQEHYRWRYDNGSESVASWKELEDFPTIVDQDTVIRLRFKIANVGSLNSSASQYRIEYGEKLSTCAAAAWTAVPANDLLDWQASSSAYYSDGEATSQQLSNIEGYGFAAGEIKELSNQTGALSLAGDECTEIEFAIKATGNATDNPYCFRLSNAGAPIDYYDNYAEVSVVGDNNVYIISLDSSGNEQWAVKRVNNDSSAANQINPKIAVSENYGTATTVVVWVDDRGGNYDIYAQSFDISGNKLWNSGSDLLITGSSTDEYSPQVIIDANDNVLISWVEDSPSVKKIYLQKYNLFDASHWANPKALVNSIFDAFDPFLALDSNNNIYLAYTESVIGIETAYLAKFDTAGNKQWETQANLENATANQNEPSIGMDSTLLYVSWTDDRDSNYDIYAQKYDLNGNAQWAVDTRLSINIGSSTQRRSSLLVNSLSEPWAVWQDDQSGNFEIYATEFTDPGAVSAKANIDFTIRGTKTISETPLIYEYEQTLATDGSGQADLNLEWDTGYYLDLVSETIKLRDPVQPLELLPGETKTWYIFVQ